MLSPTQHYFKYVLWWGEGGDLGHLLSDDSMTIKLTQKTLKDNFPYLPSVFWGKCIQGQGRKKIGARTKLMSSRKKLQVEDLRTIIAEKTYILSVKISIQKLFSI